MALGLLWCRILILVDVTTAVKCCSHSQHSQARAQGNCDYQNLRC